MATETFKGSHEDQAWCLFAAAALSGMNARTAMGGGAVFSPDTATQFATRQADQMLREFRARIDATKQEANRGRD